MGALSFDHLLRELEGRGLLLDADPVLPSVARLVIGGPFKGSWWAHSLSNEIYMLSQQLEHHPDVVFARLVSAKMTHVHRRLWSELYAVAISRAPWQTADLADSARKLLVKVEDSGCLRLNEVSRPHERKAIGEDARVLQSRLLVFAEDVHTESGAHTKMLATWPRWASRVGFIANRVPVELAKARFDEIIGVMNLQYSSRAFLPWNKPARRARAAQPKG
jgi:hypothetical protein